MRLPTALLLASTILSGSAALAADDAAPSSPDDDIRVVSYSPLKRTEIIGVIGQPSTITFPEGEFVYRVVPAAKVDKDGNLEPAGWRGPDTAELEKLPLENNLALWPVYPGQSTMTVITCVVSPDRGLTGVGCESSGGRQKTYAFKLVAVPDDASALTIKNIGLNVIFRGTTPDHPAAPAHAVVVRTAATAARPKPTPAAWAAAAITKERLRTDSFNGSDGDCHYIGHGKRPSDIEPRCPIDNGVWTLMRFPGLSKQPAVYVGTCEKGKDNERLAHQHSDGDFVVVEEIASSFCLRLGDSVLNIINQTYRPEGNPTSTGTTSPTVVRDVIQAKAAH